MSAWFLTMTVIFFLYVSQAKLPGSDQVVQHIAPGTSCFRFFYRSRRYLPDLMWRRDYPVSRRGGGGGWGGVRTICRGPKPQNLNLCIFSAKNGDYSFLTGSAEGA